MEREAVSGVCCKKDQRNEKIAKGDVGLKEGFSYGKILFLNTDIPIALMDSK